MNTQVSKLQQIKFEAVYLSEMKPVISIYKNLKANSYSHHSPGEAVPIPHFGLPLAVASYGKEVIGFASATIDTADQVEINCFNIQKYEEKEIIQRLKEQAIKVFNFSFKQDDQSNTRLKASITALDNWIEKCDQAQ